MRVIVEGFGSNEAFIKTNDGTMTVPRHRVPQEAEVGDCLVFRDGVYVLDAKQNCRKRTES